MSKSMAEAILQHFSDNDTYLGTDMTIEGEAAFLARELEAKGFGKVPLACTCSILVQGTDYRCKLHPTNQALTFDQRMEFEQRFDQRVKEGQS